jgi:CHAT domain-containing protein
LIDPIRDQIAGIETLYIAADGPFAEVPFGALTSADGEWLAGRYRIVYSPPTGGASQPAAFGLRNDLSVVAAGYGEASQVLQTVLPSLAGVDDDLQAAAAAWPRSAVLKGSEATLENLREALANAGVFHFSGHAIVSAGDAALVLAPGGSGGQDRLLWASQMPKQALRRCRLVMLAACSTGRAAGEDSDPSSVLARAFVMAGVPEVVASRWDVDSRATSVLIKLFYAKVARGASSEEALIASIRELRVQPAFAHPYYWAAFDLFRS